jgi:hypothetical protein
MQFETAITGPLLKRPPIINLLEVSRHSDERNISGRTTKSVRFNPEDTRKSQTSKPIARSTGPMMNLQSDKRRTMQNVDISQLGEFKIPEAQLAMIKRQKT